MLGSCTRLIRRLGISTGGAGDWKLGRGEEGAILSRNIPEMSSEDIWKNQGNPTTSLGKGDHRLLSSPPKQFHVGNIASVLDSEQLIEVA